MKNKNMFNIKIRTEYNRLIIAIIIICIIILLFRKRLNYIFEKFVVFTMIFLLFLLLTKNILISLGLALIIFLLINLNMGYTKMVESFSNLNEEPPIDLGIFNTDEVKNSSDNIQNLLKKINGGIELKEDDITETDKLNVDHKKYGDDKKPNALRDAQKEAYELIDTVNALKDTITTLAPVLSEGKKLMNIFENLKI